MAVPESILRAAQNIRPISTSASQLLRVVANDKYHLATVVRVIEGDPALCAAVLRIVNSATYGLDYPVDSIQRAVSYLGARMVANTAIKLCAGSLYSRELDGYAAGNGDLWRHCLHAAVAARAISRLHGEDKAPGAYLGAMLHDLGKAVLVDAMVAHGEDTVARNLRDPATDILEFLEVERKLTGTDHCEVGAALARRWRLPDSLVASIEFHHHPADAPPDQRATVYAVHLGDFLAMMGGSGTGADTLNYELDPQYQRYFRIDPMVLQGLLVTVDHEYRQAEAAFSGSEGE